MTTNIFNTYNPGPAFGIGDSWGMRFHPTKNKNLMHRGQDFPAPQGTSIPAAADGVVYWSNPLPGYGNCVVIKHTPSNGAVFYTMYAHLDQTSSLKEGKAILAGAIVGLVGMSGGQSTGFHLHFEVIPDQPLPLVKGHTTLIYAGSGNDFVWAGAERMRWRTRSVTINSKAANDESNNAWRIAA